MKLRLTLYSTSRWITIPKVWTLLDYRPSLITFGEQTVFVVIDRWSQVTLRSLPRGFYEVVIRPRS